VSLSYPLPWFHTDSLDNYSTSEFVRSAEGHEVQKRIWSELTDILENITPGIMKNI